MYKSLKEALYRRNMMTVATIDYVTEQVNTRTHGSTHSKNTDWTRTPESWETTKTRRFERVPWLVGLSAPMCSRRVEMFISLWRAVANEPVDWQACAGHLRVAQSPTAGVVAVTTRSTFAASRSTSRYSGSLAPLLNASDESSRVALERQQTSSRRVISRESKRRLSDDIYYVAAESSVLTVGFAASRWNARPMIDVIFQPPLRGQSKLVVYAKFLHRWWRTHIGIRIGGWLRH